MSISVIIPVLNEAQNLPATIASARSVSTREIIVVDGGSRDESVKVAQSQGAVVIKSRPGRALQMNQGARAAKGDTLLFLHADTLLPAGYDEQVRRALASAEIAAGAFLLSIDASRRGYRIIEYMANWRSRVLHMPYGDQGIFLRASVFQAAGGFPEIPIMEDLEFIRRVRALGRIAIAPVAAVTSPRRWQTVGILRTTVINQASIVSYFLGISPARILRMYRAGGRTKPKR
jgi:rSAM/selenodomain-associated transferase 2